MQKVQEVRALVKDNKMDNAGAVISTVTASMSSVTGKKAASTIDFKQMPSSVVCSILLVTAAARKSLCFLSPSMWLALLYLSRYSSPIWLYILTCLSICLPLQIEVREYVSRHVCTSDEGKGGAREQKGVFFHCL